MTLALRRIIVSGILSCTWCAPAAAFAQDQEPAAVVSDVSPQLGGRVGPSGLFGDVAGTRAGQFGLKQPASRSGGIGPVAMGALIGAGAALAATAAAANAYGKNESGGFCGGCMFAWSAFTVPIGAGVGAAIGYGVKRARHSVTAVPVFSRKAAGVVVTARF